MSGYQSDTPVQPELGLGIICVFDIMPHDTIEIQVGQKWLSNRERTWPGEMASISERPFSCLPII